MKDVPGNLIPTSKDKWLSLLLRSEQSAEVKLAGYVIYKTAKYNKHHMMTMTNCSLYTISLVLKTNSEEAGAFMDELLNSGWLWDTGIKTGARFAHALTVNVEPAHMKR